MLGHLKSRLGKLQDVQERSTNSLSVLAFEDIHFCNWTLIKKNVLSPL